MCWVGAGDFAFRSGRQIFAIEKFLHQIVQIGARRFVGEVRGPKQTIVAEQFDVPLRRTLFAALKDKTASGQAARSAAPVARLASTRSNRSSILLIRNGTQPQPASRKPSRSFFSLFITPEKIMLVNWRICGNHVGEGGDFVGLQEAIVVSQRRARVDREGAAQTVGFNENRAIQRVTEGKGQPFRRQDTSHHAMALYRSAQFFDRRWDVLERQQRHAAEAAILGEKLLVEKIVVGAA